MAPEIWTSLIAAGAALLGGALVKMFDIFQKLLEKHSERNELLRNKLEELADNLHQSSDWSNSILNSISEKGVRHANEVGNPQFLLDSKEARRVYVLALLYFPSLRHEAKNLYKASADFYIQACDVASINLEKIQKAASSLGSAKNALDKQIAYEAEKLT